MRDLALDINFEKNRFLMFELDHMANKYEEDNQSIIRMTLGKSELPLHPNIIHSMQDAIGDFSKSSLVYPAGLPDLKKELANYYYKHYKETISPDNIIISAGTSNIFRNIFQLLVKEGDEVLLPLPYYSLYHFSALLVGAKVKYYKIDANTMELDRESFASQITHKTKLVITNSPGNPLGNILTKEDYKFIDKTVNGKAYIISDEIYGNMCFDTPHFSCIQLKDTISPFIITNAFSKGYRMYSRRVGYCILPDELVVPLTVMQHHTLLTADPVSQFGAIEALKYTGEIEILRNLYKERRDYAVKRLGELERIRVIPSKGSFYITIDCEQFMKEYNIKSTRELAENIIDRQYVATVPGSDFKLDTMLRLSYSTTDFKEGIDRLVSYFSSDYKN